MASTELFVRLLCRWPSSLLTEVFSILAWVRSLVTFHCFLYLCVKFIRLGRIASKQWKLRHFTTTTAPILPSAPSRMQHGRGRGRPGRVVTQTLKTFFIKSFIAWRILRNSQGCILITYLEALHKSRHMLSSVLCLWDFSNDCSHKLLIYAMKFTKNFNWYLARCWKWELKRPRVWKNSIVWHTVESATEWCF